MNGTVIKSNEDVATEDKVCWIKRKGHEYSIQHDKQVWERKRRLSSQTFCLKSNTFISCHCWRDQLKTALQIYLHQDIHKNFTERLVRVLKDYVHHLYFFISSDKLFVNTISITFQLIQDANILQFSRNRETFILFKI